MRLQQPPSSGSHRHWQQLLDIIIQPSDKSLGLMWTTALGQRRLRVHSTEVYIRWEVLHLWGMCRQRMAWLVPSYHSWCTVGEPEACCLSMCLASSWLPRGREGCWH